jgi:hypothetical protein
MEWFKASRKLEAFIITCHPHSNVPKQKLESPNRKPSNRIHHTVIIAV